MKIGESIEQLKDLRADRESFLENDEPDSEFAKDIEAIDTVINAINAVTKEWENDDPSCRTLRSAIEEQIEDGSDIRNARD